MTQLELITTAGNVKVYTPWEMFWPFLRVKLNLSYDPSIPLLGICPKKLKQLSKIPSPVLCKEI